MSLGTLSVPLSGDEYAGKLLGFASRVSRTLSMFKEGKDFSDAAA